MQQTQTPETLFHPGFATCQLGALEEMTLQAREPCFTRLQDGDNDRSPARLLEGLSMWLQRHLEQRLRRVIQMPVVGNNSSQRAGTDVLVSPGPPGTPVRLSWSPVLFCVCASL